MIHVDLIDLLDLGSALQVEKAISLINYKPIQGLFTNITKHTVYNCLYKFL